MGARGVPAVERDAGRHRVDERAGGVPSIRERRMTRSARSASSSAWTHAPRPIAIAARSPSATATGSGPPIATPSSATSASRSSARSTSPVSHCEIARSRTAAGGTGSDGRAFERELRIRAHPPHPLRTAQGAQEGQPRGDRGAAVGQGAVVPRGSAASARRSASAGRPQRARASAEHGDRRIALERPALLQPREPALGGRDTAALVDGQGAPLEQPRHAVDVAGLLCVADGRLGLPRSPRTSRPRDRAAWARGPARLASAPNGAAPGRDGGTGTTPQGRPAAPGTGWSAPATRASPPSRSPREPRRRAVRTSARERRSA